MSNANLSSTHLTGAYLVDADLREADLSNAYLFNTEMLDADLTGADLRGANLRFARGLNQDQIERAIGNRKTRLPRHLQRPEAWKKSVEEQRKRLKKQQSGE